MMRQAAICIPVDRTRFCSSNAQQEGQLGPTTLRAGNFLAVLCLLFGTAFTAFVPASFEQRIGSLFFFGVIPAAGFYAGGHILGYLLVLGSELCETIAAHCFRCILLSVNNFASWISPVVSDVSIGCLMVFARCALARLSARSQK